MQAYLILTVPYKTLNKRLQTAQKHIVPEMSHILMVVAELAKVLSGCPLGTLWSAYWMAHGRSLVLKRKVVESIQVKVESTKLCKRRVEQFKE